MADPEVDSLVSKKYLTLFNLGVDEMCLIGPLIGEYRLTLFSTGQWGFCYISFTSKNHGQLSVLSKIYPFFAWNI